MRGSTNRLSSMTGFARHEDSFATPQGEISWGWELRSLNGRGLDLRLRLPSRFDPLEAKLRKKLSSAFSRGSIAVSLSYRDDAGEAGFIVNEAVLAQAIAAIHDVRLKVETELPRPEGILSMRGVLSSEAPALDDKEAQALEEAMLQSLDKAIAALVAARAEEGAELATILNGQIDEIEKLTGAAEALEQETLSQIKTRIAAQIKTLLDDAKIDQDRLAQEAAILAVKADIREELDRLKAHIDAARALLAKGGVVGRKLDFLTQEFNREANTLCSKTPGMALKNIGLSLKTVIDQFREQIQNVE